MRKPNATETTRITPVHILSVSPIAEDHVNLTRIARSVFADGSATVERSYSLPAAFSILREAPIPVVICEGDLRPGTWREMLEYISHLSDPPLLIVTSRLADEYLWAEALNLGAYDVLAKPFEATEVVRVLGLALHHWHDRNELHSVRTGQRKAAVA